MNRIKLYSYDPKNWDQLIDEIARTGDRVKIISSQELSVLAALQKALVGRENAQEGFLFDDTYFDLSMIMAGDGDRVDLWSGSLIVLLNEYFNTFQDDIHAKKFIVNKKFAKDITSVLYYFFDGIESLEKVFGLDSRVITNIVDIRNEKIEELDTHLRTHLFGNEKFKTRLIQELKRFRLFNKLGERKVFSAFVCGPSGIGKTLTAKLLHDYLAPGEPYIKINLGNYSDHNALSSLIGSPRGYVGSSKGELSGKIEASKSTVILIDEFEKASREVHNFFLEVLADGRFTDSQGREFDLNKYILIFTSNISETDFQEKVSPELRSRFDLLYRMVLLKQSEKRQYARYKIDYYTNKVNTELRVALDPEKVYSSVEQRVAQLDNIRFITREIEQAVMQQAETADGAEEQTFLNSKQ